MNGFRASVAILRRSLDRRFALHWLAGFASVCTVAALAGRAAPRAAWLLLLVAAAAPSALFDAGNDPRRRLSFFAMPLYGRQLARALCVAPCLDALAVPLALTLGLALAGRPLAPAFALAALLAAPAATLVALSARLRSGASAALYIGLALAAATALLVPPFLTPRALPPEAALAALIAFSALRAFGETLARYDPLPAA